MRLYLRIIEYVREHPGCTARDVASSLKADRPLVIARCWAAIEEGVMKKVGEGYVLQG